jgi:hypothetical protein
VSKKTKRNRERRHTYNHRALLRLESGQGSVVSRQGLILVSSLVRQDLLVTIPAVCFLLRGAFLQSQYSRSSKLQLLLVSAEVNGLGLLEELRGTRLFETVAGARSATCCDKRNAQVTLP